MKKMDFPPRTSSSARACSSDNGASSSPPGAHPPTLPSLLSALLPTTGCCGMPRMEKVQDPMRRLEAALVVGPPLEGSPAPLPAMEAELRLSQARCAVCEVRPLWCAAPPALPPAAWKLP